MSTSAGPARSGDLWGLSALELAALIRTRQASSTEVIESHLRRIEIVNPAINAFTAVLGDQSRQAARDADARLAAGAELPAWHGVPFTVKENIDLVGAATTLGLEALAGAYPDRDAPVVERLRAAGAIPLGHTNCPSLAVRWHTDSEMWGATVNPWDPSRTPGASSGGEAAAVATGMSPMGLGNDGLGSLRWPAQCCGVAALKPTLGRIPDASSLAADSPIGAQITVVQGPIARRISDLRAAFETLAGPTWRDPWSVPAPLRGPDVPTPVGVALVVDPGGHGTVRQVQDGVRRAARALEDAGYRIEEVEPPSIDSAARCLLDMLSTPDVQALRTAMAPTMPPDTRRFFSDFYEAVADPDPVRIMRGFTVRQALLRAWGEFQQTYPLIVAPIFTEVPFEAGTDLEDGRVAETIQGMRMTLAVNSLGLPAVAVPVGMAEGLPQVVQVIGPRYREDLCLDSAQAMEDRLGTLTPIEPRGLR